MQEWIAVLYREEQGGGMDCCRVQGAEGSRNGLVVYS